MPLLALLSDAKMRRPLSANNPIDSGREVGQPCRMSDEILPDLQACVLCEDVRQEASGQQTLVGIIGVIPSPVMPIGFFKLCLWTRWCGGEGNFTQQSAILNPDDDEPIAESEVEFLLPALDAHATNVHVFGGVQFPKHGIYTIEVKLDGELRLRFPLPVVSVVPGSPG